MRSTLVIGSKEHIFFFSAGRGGIKVKLNLWLGDERIVRRISQVSSVKGPGQGDITQGFQFPKIESNSGLVKQRTLFSESLQRLKKQALNLYGQELAQNEFHIVILLLFQPQIQILMWVHPSVEPRSHACTLAARDTGKVSIGLL